ncbi:MAG: hypothetical protein Q8N53_08895 [Longimicrobiales bacterium]|nr:hypothetical protein [Longimicrobiales bacterium]
MRRLYLAYLLAIVLPAALTVGGGVLLADRAWEGLRRDSQARAGRMALAALEHDLGDTVRAASAPLPSSAAQVGRATGYRTALYLSGRRWDATDPPPGPPEIDAGLLDALAGSPGGVPFADAEAEGMLVSLTAGAGTASAFAVLAAAPRGGRTALPLPLLLVMGLLLAFASLAGWIQLGGDPGVGRPRSLLLLSLVPTLTALGFLVHADRLYRDAATDANRRDLTRALAVARAREVAQEPAAIRRLTGFHAYRVLEGRVVAASLDGPARAVAALPAPPPSFTSTGTVLTPEGEASYVALRLPEGGFIAATVVPTEERMGAFTRVSAWAAAALGGWLLLVAAILGTRRASNPR